MILAMRRVWWIHALILLVLALAGAFAWLSQQPEAPWWQRAESWPVVGPGIAELRRLYLPPPPPEPVPEEEGPQVIVVERPRVAPPDPGPPPLGFLWLLPGARLLAAPEPGAAVVSELAAIANVGVLEERGDWLRVRYLGAVGWIELDAATRRGEPPLGSDPEPVRPVAAAPADEARLTQARALLREFREGQLGPYPLLTDVDQPDLLFFLGNLARELEPAYVERYRVRPVSPPRETVVLFRRRQDYLAFQGQEEGLRGLDAVGFARRGVVSLFVEDLTPEEVAATLVHELTHLLNRRAVGPALPPWLDEGLADDLGQSRIEAPGRLVAGALGGRERREGGQIHWQGSLAARETLRARIVGGELQPLRALLDLDWGRFVAPEARELHYAQAGFWVRFLLDGDGGRLASGFRGFLAAVADGEAITPEGLRRRLGASWPELEASFRAWVLFSAQRPAIDVVPEAPARPRATPDPPGSPPPSPPPPRP